LKEGKGWSERNRNQKVSP